jgi:predicted RNA-binding protein with PIN domain
MKLIIDGHNLIGQMSDLSLEEPDDEGLLVGRLRRYAARTGNTVTVVFDGGLPGGPSRELSGGGVQVVFAPAGRSADPLIIKRIRKVRDRQAWLIVSSDREIVGAAERRGLRVRRSEEFAAELSAVPAPTPPPDPREIPPSQAEVDAWLREFTKRDD